MGNTAPYKPFGILRFVLALMVLLQHFCSDIGPDYIRNLVIPWAPGNVAMLAFFIMSGFIICEAYFNNYQNQPVDYIKNRLLRIVPGYWAALIISIFVHVCLFQIFRDVTPVHGMTIRKDTHFHAYNIIKNFFAIFIPVNGDASRPKEYPFIPYSWALQVEMMFYFAVFFVGFAYKKLSRYIHVQQIYWFALAGIAGIAAAALSKMGRLPDRLEYSSYFVFGGSLYFFLSGRRKALFVMLPAFLQMVWEFQGYTASDFGYVAPYRAGQFMLMGAIILTLTFLATTHMRPKSDRKFGDLSYPIYLNHYVFVLIILNTVHTFTVGYMVLGLIGSLLLSKTLFVVVEKPLIKLRQAIRTHHSLKASGASPLRTILASLGERIK